MNKATKSFAPKLIEKMGKVALTYDEWKSKNNPDQKIWYLSSISLNVELTSGCLKSLTTGKRERRRRRRSLIHLTSNLINNITYQMSIVFVGSFR